MENIKKLLKKYIPQSAKNYFHIIQSIIASIYYGFPSRKLKLIGVTGSSGKTTTSSMIYHVLKESGYKVGLISTNGAMAGDKVLDTGLHVTSPDPIDMQRILKFMKDRGIVYVVVETSSHALAQGRMGRIQFEYTTITNITSDHLDWHGTWENYAIAKAQLAFKTKDEGAIA